MAQITQVEVTGGKIAGTVKPWSATHGDPNGPGLPRWPEFTTADPLVMRVGVNPGPAPIPNQDRLKVLDAYQAWRRGGC